MGERSGTQAQLIGRVGAIHNGNVGYEWIGRRKMGFSFLTLKITKSGNEIEWSRYLWVSDDWQTGQNRGSEFFSFRGGAESQKQGCTCLSISHTTKRKEFCHARMKNAQDGSFRVGRCRIPFFPKTETPVTSSGRETANYTTLAS